MKIGLVGFGKIGKIRLKILQKKKCVSEIFVFDLKNISYKAKKVIFVKNIEKLLKEKPDMVFICSYPKDFCYLTKLFLKNNIHVFCEKPPATCLSEINSVKKILKKNSKVILKYGFNHRYHESIMFAKKLIKNQKFGKLIWSRGIYGKAGSIDFSKDWRNYKNFSGGGILMDQGIHMLDLIRYFSISNYTKFKSIVETLYWNIKLEDNAFILMKNSSNQISFVHSSATQWKHKFNLELCFQNGYIILDGILSSTKSYAPETITYSFRKDFDKKKLGHPKEVTKKFNNDPSWELEIDEFFNCIKNNTKVLNGNIEDAVNIMSMMENIYKQA